MFDRFVFPTGVVRKIGEVVGLWKERLRSEKKQLEECPYRSRTQIYKCEVYKKLNTIYKDILNKKFSSHLEIQEYLDLQYDIIKNFIEKIAEDYYIKHYQKKMVDKFIRDFRVKVGIAMANECYGQDGECPYFVLAKEIVKPFNDR